MIHRLLSVAATLSVSALLAACPPAYPRCSSDDACKEHHETCVQGQCQECATDAQCKEGFSCDHSKCVPKPPAVTSMAPATTSPTAAQTCSADNDCALGQLCLQSHCEDIKQGQPECGLVRVHFGFNDAELKRDELPSLDRVSRCLRADHALHLTIEGNADERGTEEYNLHLSQRRAAAVEKYLVTLGVSSSQLKAIGYGYEHPLCNAHDEECWAQNRRAGLKPNPSGKR